MVAGLASAGVDVIRLGVVPTPGVAFLTGSTKADLGVMLSASHNPMPDNGIKFFARGGTKLDDAVEDAIEHRMRETWPAPDRRGRRPGPRRPRADRALRRAPGREPSAAREPRGTHGRRRLRQRCRPPHRSRRVRGPGSEGHPDPRRTRRRQHQRQLRLHAHGRSALRGRRVRGRPGHRPGRRRRSLSGRRRERPDRRRRSDPGHTRGRHEGDRPTARRHRGGDGDEQPGVLPRHGRRRASRSCRPRWATATCSRRCAPANFSLGGEQSGPCRAAGPRQHGRRGAHRPASHESDRRDRTHAGRAGGRDDADAAGAGQRPRSGQVASRHRPGLAAAVSEAKDELGDSGRVLLRPSGTESLVRVMVEAGTLEHANEVAQRLAHVVKTSLAL